MVVSSRSRHEDTTGVRGDARGAEMNSRPRNMTGEICVLTMSFDTLGQTSLAEGTVTTPDVQKLLLEVLSRGGDTRLGRGQHYFSTNVLAAAPKSDQPNPHQIMQAVWSLISQGLAYIDYSQSSADNWALYLTEAGRAAANDEEINPDDPSGYIKRLLAEVPGISQVVKGYAEEALLAYNSRLYRASTVMLGVASEAAVLDVAISLASAMKESEAGPYLEVINAKKRNYIAKFEVFQQKLRSKKDLLPEELADGLELTINAVADLLRVYRNDAGHPTGLSVERDECFIHLRMFVLYARKLYLLKAHLHH